MVKFVVSKGNAIGETLVAEVEIPSPVLADEEALRAHLRPVLRVLDDRMFEMNLRVAGANHLTKKLSPEVAMAIHQVIEMFYGMAPIPAEIQQALQEQRNGSAPLGTEREQHGLRVIDGGKGRKETE